jgi:hypothetical protein
MIEKGFVTKDKKAGRNVYGIFKEKEPKEFLIGVDISQNSPEKLLEQVLSFIGDFSPSHGVEKGGYSLIDPLTGERLTAEFNDGKPTVKVEPCSIVYPEFKMNNVGSTEPTVKSVNIEPASLPLSQGGEKVRSVERGEEKGVRFGKQAFKSDIPANEK